MARTPNARTAVADDHSVDGTAISTILNKAGEIDAHLVEVAKKYDDGMPYERGRVVTSACFWARHADGAMLQLGRNLIVLKENEPGEFHRILKETIGIHPRTAQRMMASARAFLDSNQFGRDKLSRVGDSKLQLLATLPTEKLGEIDDEDLEEFANMNYAELCEEVRKLRGESEAKDKVLHERNQKLDSLTRERKRGKPFETDVRDTLKEISQACTEAMEPLNRLAVLAEAMPEIEIAGLSDDDDAWAEQRGVIAAELMSRVSDLVSQHVGRLSAAVNSNVAPLVHKFKP